jgi:predicted dehydrogenase
LTRQIKIAIDGCGALTMHSILPHLSQPDFQAKAQVVALCDIVEERAVQFARQFDIPQVFTSYEAMLRQSGAEAVLVAVPAALHAPHAIQAARAGLHIYLQKPMAASFGEAQQVLVEAQRSGVKLAAAPGMALWPLYGQIHDLVRQGAIGRPYLAQAPMLGWGGEALDFPTNPAWFFSPEGGPLRDHGGYSIGAHLGGKAVPGHRGG